MVRIRTLVCLLLVLPYGVALAQAGLPGQFPRYPLKNGDFSAYQGWSRPAGWQLATEAGEHQLLLDKPPRTPIQPPSAAIVRSKAGGQGYIWQVTRLLAGSWRLQVEASGSSGAVAQLEVSRSASHQSRRLELTHEWQPLELMIPEAEGDTGVHLRFYTPAGGTVRFRLARLDPVRLKSEPVPIQGGRMLGGLVLAENPTDAERFAAHELQFFVQRMTGRIPGIEGRDDVFAGQRIHLGTAAATKLVDRLKVHPSDAYLVHRDSKTTTLAGNSDLSTLYSVYDFLNQQGCYWLMPGEIGEVVPLRQTLAPVANRVCVPDFPLVRSFFTGLQQFFPTGGWIYLDIDEYRDWVVRNRFNAIWTGGPTVDLGADRGHGWIQNSGHSWNALIAPHTKYFEDHPDWYPLVNGKRMPRSDVSIKLPNQLCVSNRQLRDHTVVRILSFFEENPQSRMFPMNPMDGPNYNCECANCRALDPPGYEWNQDFSDFPRFPNLKLPPMADRYLNYVNDVTQRVVAVYPQKLIEFYNYGSREPPTRERVHPSVSVKFTYLSGREINVSLMDPNDPIALRERLWLDAWSKSGTHHLTYYPYTDWEHPDAAIHWYFNITDLLHNLHRNYGCVGTMGETHTTVQADPVWWGIYARLLWDSASDYSEIIRELCGSFYGPAAAEMADFYLAMDRAVLQREGERPQNYHPNKRLELSLHELDHGRELLSRAAARVQSNPIFRHRVDLARFAHAVLTLVRVDNETVKTQRTSAIARRALDEASALRSRYSIMLRQATHQILARDR